MTHGRNAGRCLVVIALLVAIAVLATAGCTDSGPEQESPVATVHETPAGQSVTKPVPAVKPAGTGNGKAPSSPSTVSSTGVIRLDVVSDRKAGDTFILAGTTSLPAGTDILWQILPDTGTPRKGLDPDSTMSAGGNYLVTPGDGTRNRIAIPVSLGRLVPGTYVAIVGKAKEPMSDKMVFAIGNDYATANFTVK